MVNLRKKILLDDPHGTQPQAFNQLGILLLDGSGSMLDESMGGLTKHQAVDQAVRGVFTKFKSSSKRNCFSWATVVFGLDAVIQTPVTTTEKIDDNASYDPLFPKLVNGSGTCLGIGLTLCKSIADRFLENRIVGIPNKVAIVMLSDGMSEENQTRAVVQNLKRNPNIDLFACQLLSSSPSGGEAVGAALLRSIVSDATRGYTTAHDAETIRSFFISSISASAGIPSPT